MRVMHDVLERIDHYFEVRINPIITFDMNSHFKGNNH